MSKALDNYTSHYDILFPVDFNCQPSEKSNFFSQKLFLQCL